MKLSTRFCLPFLFLTIIFGFCAPAFALEGPFDHSQWDTFLKTYVNEDGEVDYAAAKQDPALLDNYLAQTQQISMREYELDWPREEKMALWLNLYHAGLVKIILEHYPVQSVKDIPGFWEVSVIQIGDRRYSLNEIRDMQLIQQFRDEKIHLVLSCGARGCPPFRREAFTGPLAEGQLYKAARAFVNDPQHNHIDPAAKKVQLSRLFKWYSQDFIMDFGTEEHLSDVDPGEAAVLSFIAYYLNDAAKLDFLETRQYKIKYQVVDWSLNESHGTPAARP